MGKKKPPNLGLETESRGYLTYILSEWVIISHDEEDYGIDFTVKKTTTQGEQLQPEFDIQLKSSTSYNGQDTVAERLETSNLDDYMRSRKPVFLMVYDREVGEIYWEPIQPYVWENYGRDPREWKSQDTITVQLDRIPLKDSREDVYEAAKTIEESIHHYVREQAFMEFLSYSYSRSTIQDALLHKESQKVEIMSEPLYSNIRKIATGMANAGGGVIVVGFEETGYNYHKTIEGVDDPDRVVSEIDSYFEDIDPPIRYETFIESIEGNPVVGIEIREYAEIPHAYDGRFYIRRGSQTEYLESRELAEFYS